MFTTTKATHQEAYQKLPLEQKLARNTPNGKVAKKLAKAKK
jgi:hypothetical protein